MSEHIDTKAKSIIANGYVMQVDDGAYIVKSPTSGSNYNVSVDKLGIFLCSCPAGEHKGYCSHIQAVKITRESAIENESNTI